MKTITLPADTRHLYLDEVAHLIADYNEPEGPNDPDGVRYELVKIQAESELHQAATAEQLNVRHPGTHGPFPIELGLKRAVLLVPDVVAYLADRGMPVVMGEPEPQNTTASPAPVAAETIEQRRARYLVMFETEEKRDKRGALQRVADRERVDRSNMKKDIDKARAIRTEQSRAGFFVSQLVQDGKRKL